MVSSVVAAGPPYIGAPEVVRNYIIPGNDMVKPFLLGTSIGMGWYSLMKI